MASSSSSSLPTDLLGEFQTLSRKQQKKILKKAIKRQSEKDKIKSEEEENEKKVLGLLDIPIFMGDVAMTFVSQLTEIFSPIGMKEFERLTKLYGSNQIHKIRPHDNDFNGYIISLKGDTILSPEEHIHTTSPFGCIGMYHLKTIKTIDEIDFEKMKEYVCKLTTRKTPTLDWVKVDENKGSSDAQAWETFLPKQNASIGIYINKKQKTYWIMVNSHLDENIIVEISNQIKEKKLTAEEFGTNKHFKHLIDISARNVQRIIAEISKSIFGIPEMSFQGDFKAVTEPHEEDPIMCVPTCSWHYNDFSWSDVFKRLNFYHNLSGGKCVSTATTSTPDQIIIGPYRLGFKLLKRANYIAKSSTPDSIYGLEFSTNLTDKKVKVSEKVVFCSKKSNVFDYSKFNSDEEYIEYISKNKSKSDHVETFKTVKVFIP